jgi:hypothetical protein
MTIAVPKPAQQVNVLGHAYAKKRNFGQTSGPMDSLQQSASLKLMSMRRLTLGRGNRQTPRRRHDRGTAAEPSNRSYLGIGLREPKNSAENCLLCDLDHSVKIATLIRFSGARSD